jgi:hypothetical protein
MATRQEKHSRELRLLQSIDVVSRGNKMFFSSPVKHHMQDDHRLERSVSKLGCFFFVSLWSIAKNPTASGTVHLFISKRKKKTSGCSSPPAKCVVKSKRLMF